LITLKERGKRPKKLYWPRIFIDRSTSSNDLHTFLSKAGWPLERHCEYFDADTDDDIWIQEIAAVRQWVILTSDRALERTEIDSIISSKAKVIILTDNHSGWVRWAAALVAAQESINATLHEYDGPLVMRVAKTGNVSKVRQGDDLIEFQQRLRTRRILRAKRAGTFNPKTYLTGEAIA